VPSYFLLNYFVSFKSVEFWPGDERWFEMQSGGIEVIARGRICLFSRWEASFRGGFAGVQSEGDMRTPKFSTSQMKSGNRPTSRE
jgi:hypothetical protein